MVQILMVTGTVSDKGRVRQFWWCAILTVATIYALIMVGGIVRASGAGMGCPDWPTCFGQWVPPTHESQLPANYQEIYADRGYADTTFNVRKTWTEYLNRLLGVFTGFTILLTLLFAIPLRGKDPKVVWLSLAGFILVGVQGWLGAQVVATNLKVGMITIHMLLAQVIVGIVIAAVIRVRRENYRLINLESMPRLFYPLMLLAMGAGLLQLLMGTQVREAMDLIARSHEHDNRHLWIDSLPFIFTLHKYYTVPLVALNGWLAYTVLTHSDSVVLRRLCIALMVFILGAIAIGLSMARLHVPIFSQPMHLWLASVIFGTQLAILLIVQHARDTRSQALSDAPDLTFATANK